MATISDIREQLRKAAEDPSNPNKERAKRALAAFDGEPKPKGARASLADRAFVNQLVEEALDHSRRINGAAAFKPGNTQSAGPVDPAAKAALDRAFADKTPEASITHSGNVSTFSVVKK